MFKKQSKFAPLKDFQNKTITSKKTNKNNLLLVLIIKNSYIFLAISV